MVQTKLFPPIVGYIVKDFEPAATHSVSIDFHTVTKSYKNGFERSSKILRLDSQSDALGSQIGVSASDKPVENGAPGAFLNLISDQKRPPIGAALSWEETPKLRSASDFGTLHGLCVVTCEIVHTNALNRCAMSMQWRGFACHLCLEGVSHDIRIQGNLRRHQFSVALCRPYGGRAVRGWLRCVYTRRLYNRHADYAPAGRPR